VATNSGVSVELKKEKIENRIEQYLVTTKCLHLNADAIVKRDVKDRFLTII